MWGSTVNKNDWEMHTIPFHQPLFAQCVGKNHYPIRIMRPDWWSNSFVAVGLIGSDQQIVSVLLERFLKAGHQWSKKTIPVLRDARLRAATSVT